MGVETIKSAKSAVSSDFFPNLTFVFDYGFQGEKYEFTKDADYWMASMMFKWNLFSGMETSRKNQELEAQISAMKLSSESAKHMIKLDVTNNYLSYQNAFEQLETAKKAYMSSAENFTLNKLRYAEGLNSFISLLDAETTLNSSKEMYIITYYEILTAKARLEKSMGLATY
jgi:outer membrane protein TolC